VLDDLARRTTFRCAWRFIVYQPPQQGQRRPRG
jgi:hypothetical protein